ncbi:MAG: hypothetical protein AAGA10_23880 [Bacteroidota bacterium]
MSKACNHELGGASNRDGLGSLAFRRLVKFSNWVETPALFNPVI